MTSPTLKMFFVTIGQPLFYSTLVNAPDEATAKRHATDAYRSAVKLGELKPLSIWRLTFLEWQYADVAEVQP